jgi:nucleotide-binding universal stress UspA family protein
MSTQSSGTSIVVGVDGSPDSLEAVRWAAGLAGRGSSRTLDLVAAVALPPIPTEAWLQTAATLIEEAESEAGARLETVARGLRENGIDVRVHLRRWLPAESILDLARETGARLIARGRRGRSTRQALLGSVSGEVSRAARVPVVVVRGAATTPPRKLLLGVDGSAASRAAAAAVASWFPEAEIVAASVRHDAEGLDEARLRAELDLAGLASAAVRERFPAGHVAAELLRLAEPENVDLICAGRRGHGPLHDLFVGSVAEKLLQLSPVPLLLAH